MTAGWIGQAPGRLDFMGGVGDYSGSLVLQMPIRQMTRVTIRPLRRPVIDVRSAPHQPVELPLEPLRDAAPDALALRSWLHDEAVPHWAPYVIGCFTLHCQAQGWWPDSGLRFQIDSKVPISMGVSSSAALEVATLRALEAASGKRYAGTALARLAQQAENQIVGAPCGLMDQLASAHGEAGSLLPILCRPDTLGRPVPLPAGTIAVGWPSGVTHAVSASPYATARTAAFMAKKILESELKRSLSYLTELAPSEVASRSALPAELKGQKFLDQWGEVDDPLSKVQPRQHYPVAAAAAFATEENFRCNLALNIFRSASPSSEASLRLVGELMYLTHGGYSSIGLGSPETDQMVEAIRSLGPDQGFYGARISGGGSGGTVAVLLRRKALPKLKKLAHEMHFSPAGPLPLIV